MKKLPLLLAITLAVVLIGQALLSNRATFVAKKTSSGVAKSHRSLVNGGATDTQSTKPVVDMRGKGAIDPEEVLYAERGWEEGEGRATRDGESASEAEREREKGRYQFVGRLPKFG